MKNEKWMKVALFFFSFSFFLLFFSCGSDSEEGIGGDTPIRLSAQTIDGIGARSIIEGKVLPENLAVGVYITENGGTNLSIASNQKYTVNATGGLNVVGGSQPYYPSSGKGVKMSAYYPYNNSSDSYYFKVAVDQSSDDAYNASDLLYSASTSYTRQTTAHRLVFAHKLSRITYTLEPKDGAPSLEGAVVSIVNVFTGTEFNRITGVLNGLNAKTSIVSHAKGAIVVPQIIAANDRLIEVAAGGNKYYYKPTEDLIMLSGKSYDFKIGVTGTQLQVTYTVSDWTPGTIEDNGGEVSARSYRVGDYYPDPNVDLTVQAEKDKIQGIVFWIDPAGGGKHGKIVSLDEGTGKNWDKAKTWCTAKGDAWYLPAKDELKALYAGYSGLKYEGINSWDDYDSMPGYDDLTCKDARTAFDAKLIAAGGAVLSPVRYWSSSEDGSISAWVVHFTDGDTDYSFKNDDDRVRAVSAF